MPDLSEPITLPEWGVTCRVFDQLNCPNPIWNPAVEVAQAVGAVFRPATPYEVVSDERPTWGDELVPYDRLGKYTSSDRMVTIFRRLIEEVAPSLDCKPEDLEALVRFHEYAHGIIHLGMGPEEECEVFLRNPPRSAEDWNPEVARATERFGRIDSETHEFAAQLITWEVLVRTEHPEAERLRNLFVGLMPQQPQQYHLPSRLLTAENPRPNLRLMLDVCHGRCLTPIPEGHTLRDAVQELAVSGMA